MSSSHIPSFLAATAERLQAGASVVAEGVAWKPPFEGAGFTSCVKPALRGGVTGKIGETRPVREAPVTRSVGAFATTANPTLGSLEALSAESIGDRGRMGAFAREAASALDEQWKTREIAVKVAPITPEPVPEPHREPVPEPTSGERLQRLLAPSESTAVTPAPSPVLPERFAPIPTRTATVDEALTRLGGAPNRGTGSAALLRDMIATLANRDSATMRALSPPPKPANTSLASEGRPGSVSQTKSPPPLPPRASSRSMPKLPEAPLAPGKGALPTPKK